MDGPGGSLIEAGGDIICPVVLLLSDVTDGDAALASPRAGLEKKKEKKKKKETALRECA